MDKAVEYAKTRVIFEEPIGSYQAIQHPTVRAKTDIELAKLAVARAVRAYDNNEDKDEVSVYTFERVAEKVGKIFDMPYRDVMLPGKQPHRVKALSVLAYWAVQELGMSVTAVGLRLGVSQSAASRAVQRGRDIAEELELNPEMTRNA